TSIGIQSCVEVVRATFTGIKSQVEGGQPVLQRLQALGRKYLLLLYESYVMLVRVFLHPVRNTAYGIDQRWFYGVPGKTCTIFTIVQIVGKFRFRKKFSTVPIACISRGRSQRP